MRVDLNDTENEHPVPTVRTDGDTVYLIAASAWITFMFIVYVCSTKPVTDCLHGIASKFHRTKVD